MKIKKKDTVKILKGKDAGKTGTVIKVLRKENKVVVEGLNLYKKHLRPKRQNEKGQIVQIPRPIYASNVMLICPSCHKATRVGYVFIDGEKKQKQRQCKKCQAVFN